MIRNIVLISLLTTGFLMAEPTVVVREVEESRHKKFVQEDNGFKNFNQNTMVLKIDFKDKGFRAASKYKFEITSAKDSSGKELKEKGFNAGKFQSIDRKNMFFGMRDKNVDPDLLRLKLSLDSSARSATSVNIQGNLILKAGDQKAVIIKNVASMTNKEIANAVLTKAGVKIVVNPKSKFGNSSDNQVRCEVSGKNDAIADISLIDSKGESASNGSSRSGFGGKDSYYFYTKGKPGNDVHLKIMIVENIKEVKVPLNIKNQPLP